MTAREVAQVFQSKRAGKGKWIALCPVHGESNPSLSIREGHKCVLLRCWSGGCAIKDICEAVGLKQSDLFYNAMESDPKARQELARKRAGEERQAKLKHRKEMAMIDKANRYQIVTWHLGKLLAKQPNDGMLGRLFHRTIDSSRECQRAIMHLFPKSDPSTFEECAPGRLVGCTAREFGPQIAGYLRLPNA